MPSVTGMVGAKLRILVFANIRSGYKTLFLTDITRPPHTDKAAFDQIILRLAVQSQGIDQHGKIVGVTTHYLQKAVVTGRQGVIINAIGVHLAKAKFTALSNKTLGLGQIEIRFFFVLKGETVCGALDHHTSLFQSRLTGVSGLQTNFFKVGHAIGFDCQFCATAHQTFDLGTIFNPRRVFVKRNFVY